MNRTVERAFSILQLIASRKRGIIEGNFESSNTFANTENPGSIKARYR